MAEKLEGKPGVLIIHLTPPLRCLLPFGAVGAAALPSVLKLTLKPRDPSRALLICER